MVIINKTPEREGKAANLCGSFVKVVSAPEGEGSGEERGERRVRTLLVDGHGCVHHLRSGRNNARYTTIVSQVAE